MWGTRLLNNPKGALKNVAIGVGKQIQNALNLIQSDNGNVSKDKVIPVAKPANASQEIGGTLAGAAALAIPELAGARSTHPIQETTTLYRAVDTAEASSISSENAFLPSPTGSEYKGFFFNEEDAQSFATRMGEMTNTEYKVVTGEAPSDLVNSSPAHDAATEGSGVLISNDDLSKVTPK